MQVESWFLVGRFLDLLDIKMHRKKERFPESGFSLAAVMVAVGILGVLAYVFSSMFSNEAKFQKALELQIARMAIVRNLNTRKSEYCPDGGPLRINVPASCSPEVYLEIPSLGGVVIVSQFDPANPLNAQLMGEMRVRAKCTMINGKRTLKVESVDNKKLTNDPNNDANWKDVSPKEALSCDIGP